MCSCVGANYSNDNKIFLRENRTSMEFSNILGCTKLSDSVIDRKLNSRVGVNTTGENSFPIKSNSEYCHLGNTKKKKTLEIPRPGLKGPRTPTHFLQISKHDSLVSSPRADIIDTCFTKGHLTPTKFNSHLKFLKPTTCIVSRDFVFLSNKNVFFIAEQSKPIFL